MTNIVHKKLFLKLNGYLNCNSKYYLVSQEPFCNKILLIHVVLKIALNLIDIKYIYGNRRVKYYKNLAQRSLYWFTCVYIRNSCHHLQKHGPHATRAQARDRLLLFRPHNNADEKKIVRSSANVIMILVELHSLSQSLIPRHALLSLFFTEKKRASLLWNLSEHTLCQHIFLLLSLWLCLWNLHT